MRTRVEYVWLDGRSPLPRVRSKTKFVDYMGGDFPTWNFDGGSTEQGSLDNSDRKLLPVRTYKDPFHEGGYMVLCEVTYHDGKPHETNSRAVLRNHIDPEQEMWAGFEQEFTFFNPTSQEPLGFLLNPQEQGQYYCGAGCMNVIGRYILDEFEEKCEEAGLFLYGINAEVMPGQWEFQTNATDPLKASDDLWMARYILERVAETKAIVVSYDPKPVEELNGAGCHTNISTKHMRERLGLDEIEELMVHLEVDHSQHILVCGDGIERRMTGDCETSDYNTFSWGVGNRGASIRIPEQVSLEGRGYIEDRRPCANIDPYALLNSHVLTLKKVRTADSCITQ